MDMIIESVRHMQAAKYVSGEPSILFFRPAELCLYFAFSRWSGRYALRPSSHV